MKIHIDHPTHCSQCKQPFVSVPHPVRPYVTVAMQCGCEVKVRAEIGSTVVTLEPK